jgi:RNA polymerase sigma-70 factor (ECF subfamily)
MRDTNTDQLPETDHADEAEWVRQLQAGSDAAFERLVRTFGGRMLVVAKRYVASEEDARDVVQAAYLSAFRALNQFHGACRLSTWLHRIVVNAALMKLRSQRRRPEEPIEPLLPAYQADGHHVEQFADWSAAADQRMEAEETRALVRACIEQLPPGYRTVLLLRDIEQLSTQEAAEMLAMTPTAVKVRLHRARQALSTLLHEQYAAGRPAASQRRRV